MQYIHTKCGGIIDTKSKTCIKCHKHWNWLTWWTTATEIRPIPETKRARIRKVLSPAKPGTRSRKEVREAAQKVIIERKGYAKWLENRIPGVGAVASRLPNWPRWVRILVTTLVVGGLLCLILWWLLW